MHTTRFLKRTSTTHRQRHKHTDMHRTTMMMTRTQTHAMVVLNSVDDHVG